MSQNEGKMHPCKMQNNTRGTKAFIKRVKKNRIKRKLAKASRRKNK